MPVRCQSPRGQAGAAGRLCGGRMLGLDSWLMARRTSAEGATAVEYALIVGLVAVVIVVAVALFGRGVLALFEGARTIR